MALPNDLSNIGSIANAVFNSIAANTTVITTITVGNTTVNAAINTTTLTVANSTANAVINTTGFAVGTTLANTVINSTTFTIANSTANAVVNTTGFAVGTTLANTVINSTTFTIANTTANAVINTTGFAVGTTLANTVINSTTFTIANSTANAVINSAAFTIANSTVTFSYVAPTSTQKANTTFYLNANGSWAAIAAGGGSGSFNTNNNTAIAIAPNTTFQTAYTAPATAGIRYIIYSIHVTNIGSANASISGSFNGTTYANIAFAQSVPVPVGSSVEMLKKPKIMQPSDTLRLQANTDLVLHATISYETQSSTTLFGAGVDITTAATYTDLYTATAVAVVESVLLMNDDSIYDCKARVVWTDGSNNIQGYYCYDLIIPAGATIEVLEASKALPSGYKVRVYCNVADRMEATIAGKVSG